jgi:hypothetical protein
MHTRRLGVNTDLLKQHGLAYPPQPYHKNALGRVANPDPLQGNAYNPP